MVTLPRVVAVLGLLAAQTALGFVNLPCFSSASFVSKLPPPPAALCTQEHGRSTSATELGVIKKIGNIFRRKGEDAEEDKDATSRKDDEGDKQSASGEAEETKVVTSAAEGTDAEKDETEAEADDDDSEQSSRSWVPGILKPKDNDPVSVCIIGGGVSGLAAGITCAKALGEDAKVVLVEAAPTVGGRVQSDTTDDGYTLDRGFAVFIEEYPEAKKLLHYEDLQLGKFLPGALVKVPNLNRLARVADPLRQPGEVFDALLAPVGDIFDKVGILSLVLHVKGNSIAQLFEEADTSTKEALTKRWMYSDAILDRFFKPFLEGIYLAPVEEQSSRMFSFVFKMFSEGAATLPAGGMGAVSQQLADTAMAAGVDLRLDTPVTKILPDNKNGGYTVVTKERGGRIAADTVIVATDGVVANELISQLNGFESLESLPEQVQRSVGNLYYAFKGEAPVTEPILILNGLGKERGSKTSPVNNVCFPSVVAPGYAPEGHSLCSVTVLKDTMDQFDAKDGGGDEALDAAVRKQLSAWFPDHKAAIQSSDNWELKRIYRIPKAQPGQFKGPFPANVHGARPSNTYRNKELPTGLFVCGDHMATATLNGALESGVKAGKAALQAVSKQS